MKIFINLLTISRIIIAALIFYLLSEEKYLISLLFFIVASITDYFDGMLARRFNYVSNFGEILDPVADKVLIIFIFFALSLELQSFLFNFLSSIVISREILVAALRDFNSRRNKSSITSVTFLAKIKTTVQMITITIYLVALTLNNSLVLIIGDVLMFISTLVTSYTGYQYFLKSIKA